MNEELILGIDGGGSKTRALLATRDGAVRSVGVAGSSNYQSVGFEPATRAIRAAIGQALHHADLDTEERLIAAACLGLAGVDRPEDQALFTDWLAEQQLCQRCTIVNDAELVLAAGTPDGWGLALICGTGSICFGRAPDGTTARAGGWGHLLGDEGSGYDIGVHALRLATQTADGRAEAHTLLRAILDRWQLDEPNQLIGYVYRQETTRADIATLARVVAQLAEDGDRFAEAIVTDAARELGRLIAAVARKLDLREPPLALAGGLIGGYLNLQKEVIQQSRVPLAAVRYVNDPAEGALVLARRLLH